MEEQGWRREVAALADERYALGYPPLEPINTDDNPHAPWPIEPLCCSYHYPVTDTERRAVVMFEQCSDCGRREFPIHPDSDAQRGEPVCVDCVRKGAFDA